MGSDPASVFNKYANALGAATAFPFSGLNLPGSLASVAAQANGPNASTFVEWNTLVNTLAQNSGTIDIVAYSGHAAAFTDAYKLLDSADQARIGSILYISPGAVGQIAVIPGKTTVVEGNDLNDGLAMAFTKIPRGVPVIKSSCAHTDLACLFSAASSQLIAIGSRGQCVHPASYTLIPNNSGGGGVVNANGSYFGSGGPNDGGWGFYYQWLLSHSTPSVDSTFIPKPIE